MARRKTDYIVIHASATKPSQDIGAKEIDRWHRERGWLKIGYNFVIKRDGTREEGRGIMEIPAHAKGYNHKSIGVCLIGGVTEDDIKVAENNFTQEQWAELDVLMRELTDMFPKTTIIGHNEISNKDCPSFSVYEWLKDKSYANIKRMMR